MRVRRRFQFALFATIVFGAGYEAIPRTINAIHTIEQRHELAAATVAFARLRVPSNFAPVHSGCEFYPCYLVPEPAGKVELALPAILASIHAEWRNLANNVANTPPGYSLPRGARLGPVPGCATTARLARPLTTCHIEGLIDGQAVTVFLDPYGRSTNESIIWFLSPRGNAALTRAQTAS
jgi:hypothetical protein